MENSRFAHPTLERRKAWPHTILAGFIASAAMLTAFFLAYGCAALLAQALEDGPTQKSTAGWLHGLTTNVVIDLAAPNFAAAVLLYFFGGLVWAALYSWAFYPRLSGPHWYRGLLFALVPWLFSVVVLLPLVGGGMFGFALGAGPLPLLGNLLLHAVYGSVLGQMYGPMGQTVDSEEGIPRGSDVQGIPASEAGAAKGILAGAALGVGASGLVLFVSQLAVGGSPLGVNPSALLVGATLIGSTWGAVLGGLVGSTSTVAPRSHVRS